MKTFKQHLKGLKFTTSYDRLYAHQIMKTKEHRLEMDKLTKAMLEEHEHEHEHEEKI